MGQEVTLRRRMTPSLAGITDYGGIKLPSVVIWAGIAPARVTGNGGIAWASRCTPGISIVANALATEVTPTAVHIHSKYCRGIALNDRRSTLVIVRRVPNAKYPIHPRYTVLGNPSRRIPINPIRQFHHT